MARVIAEVFQRAEDAEQAIRDLIHANFTDDKIGVVVHNRDIGPDLADDLGREYRSGMNPPARELTSPSDVYETLPGGFGDALRRDNTPADAPQWFVSQLDAGKVLVIVDAGDRGDDAVRILRNHGGLGYPGASSASTAMPAPTPMPTTATGREELHVPVIEEEVTVEKVIHEVGTVEVMSDTTTQSVEVPTTVTHEEIRVERRKLDHPLRPDEYTGSTGEQGIIRMPIIEEELRVTKTPVIREELVITRTPVTERQTLRESVMHAEPHVETTGQVNIVGEEQERPAA